MEAKAAGSPLIFELRAMGIPVSDYTPSRGNDKIARVNAVSDLFASGVVWAPKTNWAEEVIEEFAAFPVGEHDDLVDSSTQALLRFRQGGFVRVPSDEKEEELKKITLKLDQLHSQGKHKTESMKELEEEHQKILHYDKQVVRLEVELSNLEE